MDNFKNAQLGEYVLNARKSAKKSQDECREYLDLTTRQAYSIKEKEGTFTNSELEKLSEFFGDNLLQYRDMLAQSSPSEYTTTVIVMKEGQVVSQSTVNGNYSPVRIAGDISTMFKKLSQLQVSQS